VNTVSNITITIVNITHCFVFYLKHIVSETEFYLRLQMEATQFSTIDTVSERADDSEENIASIFIVE
jgi:hypothetical protein